QVGRKPFAQRVLVETLQRGVDPALQRACTDACYRRIHRIERLTELHVLVLAQQAVAGMHHLETDQAAARLAEDEHPPAGDELLGLATAKVEEAQRQVMTRLVDDSHPQLRTKAEAALDLYDAPQALGRLAVAQRVDPRQLCAVFVAKRQVKPKIRQRCDAGRRELLQVARSDTRQGQRLSRSV